MRASATLRRVPRRFAYTLIAAVLALGAPAGLLLVWRVHGIAGHVPTLLYVVVSTLFAFSGFGYFLGRRADALAELSRTDPLTSLRNQRAFEERLDDEVARARRYHTPLALLLADIDGLKAINDGGGHEAGNVALRAVADAFRCGARQTDLAARIGGDEFALIAPNTNEPAAVALGERLRLLVARHARPAATVSVGVATLDGVSAGAGALWRAADAALYEAKRAGRNRVAGAA